MYDTLDLRMGDLIKDNIKKNSELLIMSEYISIYAYKELKKEFDGVSSVKLLLKDSIFIDKSEKDDRLETINNENKIFNNEYEIELRNNLNQSYIARQFSKWVEDKVEVRSIENSNVRYNTLIVDNDFTISEYSSIDMASIGYISPKNYDKYCETFDESKEQRKIGKYKELFNRFWQEEKSKDVKIELLDRLKSMYKDNSPEFIYFMTIHNLFKDYTNEDETVKTETGFKDTEIWSKLYRFQKDGVIGAIEKLEKYNGCIIADSVGLGKTFEALAVIKYYELRNSRVLVLAPKKLRDNWSIYTKNDRRNIFVDDRFNYDILNHTDLSRKDGMSGDIDLSTINLGNYDLVVIDESHNFRNNVATKNKETRYSRLMKEIIKKGVKTKVLLLSATPVNNKMNDIKNQIAFITESNDRHFESSGIKSVETTLRNAQMIFNRWLKLDEAQRTSTTFLNMINFDYFKLLDTITIARSRKHIEKYYDINDIGKFPERLKPINIKTNIDYNDEFEKIKELNKSILELNLSIYSPLKYVLPHLKEKYSNIYDTNVKNGKTTFKQTDRETNVIHLMRTNILKRLESSISSFNITVERILDKIDSTILVLNSSNDIIKEDDLDIEEEYLIGDKVNVNVNDVDKIKWRQDLLEDRSIIVDILERTKKIDSNRDAKLIELKNVIKQKIQNPINKDNKKIIIFTTFADTANYLYENISEWGLKNFNIHSSIVSGSSTNKTTLKGIKGDMNDILMNFSPTSKERKNVYPNINDEIDILIATDCISEGQNLQDCDCLINYDIHWNPVRIIQRFGRIDRLGSTNDKIQLINFWPNIELDEYINLEARVRSKMIILDVSATGEENIISDNDKMNDLKYRKNQLKQLQDNVLDLEDVYGGISITDFSMNDFKMDLSDYNKNNELVLEKAHKGTYALVKSDKKGVIFCLKQVYEAKNIDNAFYPYYLVFVGEDGIVELTYQNTKQILDLYRNICLGKEEVLEELVNKFNDETNNGKNMKKYTKLLDKAVNNILGQKDDANKKSIFSMGESTLFDEKISDFEVISFLVLM
ncbi:MAG: helicase-related protein [Peptostreptococcaceae bacterium]